MTRPKVVKFCKKCGRETEHYTGTNGKAGACIECRRAYNQSPKRKAAQRAYNQSPKGKAAQRAYRQSPKGKEWKRAWRQSPKGKEWKRAYSQSPHGREKERGYRIEEKMQAMNAYGGPRCSCCGETLIEGLTLDHIDGQGANHRKENPVKSGTTFYAWLRKRGYPDGYQVLCGTCNKAKGTGDHCPHNGVPNYVATSRRKGQMHDAYVSLKTRCLDAYGGRRCACCGETLLEGLTLDHINGDGAAHRREQAGENVGHFSGTSLYVWLRKNGFPPGFQVLCQTCNDAKGTSDHCPHLDLPMALGIGMAMAGQTCADGVMA